MGQVKDHPTSEPRCAKELMRLHVLEFKSCLTYIIEHVRDPPTNGTNTQNDPTMSSQTSPSTSETVNATMEPFSPNILHLNISGGAPPTKEDIIRKGLYVPADSLTPKGNVSPRGVPYMRQLVMRLLLPCIHPTPAFITCVDGAGKMGGMEYIVKNSINRKPGEKREYLVLPGMQELRILTSSNTTDIHVPLIFYDDSLFKHIDEPIVVDADFALSERDVDDYIKGRYTVRLFRSQDSEKMFVVVAAWHGVHKKGTHCTKIRALQSIPFQSFMY
jgi:hypothetical protein